MVKTLMLENIARGSFSLGFIVSVITTLIMFWNVEIAKIGGIVTVILYLISILFFILSIIEYKREIKILKKYKKTIDK